MVPQLYFRQAAADASIAVQHSQEMALQLMPHVETYTAAGKDSLCVV